MSPTVSGLGLASFSLVLVSDKWDSLSHYNQYRTTGEVNFSHCLHEDFISSDSLESMT